MKEWNGIGKEILCRIYFVTNQKLHRWRNQKSGDQTRQANLESWKLSIYVEVVRTGWMEIIQDGGNCYYYEVAFEREMSNKHSLLQEYIKGIFIKFFFFLTTYEDKFFVKETSSPLTNIRSYLYLFFNDMRR